MLTGVARPERYPFLPQAKESLAASLPDLMTFVSAPEFADAREAGVQRVLAALEGRALSTRDAGTPRDLMAYAYARVLVSVLKEGHAVRRLALAEALRVSELLNAEASSLAVSEVAMHVDLAFEPAGDAFEASFVDFVGVAALLKDEAWKLVRQEMRAGRVRLAREKAVRLVQEAFRRRVEKELPLAVPEDAAKAMMLDVARVRAEIEKHHAKWGPVGDQVANLAYLPPCMKALLAQLQRGENVPQTGRFAITAFLRGVGMNADDIVGLFAQAPDFREDKTRYQVEHITGVTSDTEYSAPNCATMTTFGHCVGKDALCTSFKRDGEPRVKHPWSYYNFRQWEAERKGKRPAAEESGAPKRSAA